MNNELLNRYFVLERRLNKIDILSYIMNEDFSNRSFQWCRVYHQTKKKVDILSKLLKTN